MNSNLVTIIENVSYSAYPIQRLISGMAYVGGVCLFIVALSKLRKLADNSKENWFVPFAYILGASTMLFLPSMYDVAANTLFGSGNILQYTSQNQTTIYSVMFVIIQTAGIIWFVRGVFLITNASQPGIQHGPKGLMFILAGILSMNLETTISWLSWVMSMLSTYTLGYGSR